jgi:hypothetical protein
LGAERASYGAALPKLGHDELDIFVGEVVELVDEKIADASIVFVVEEIQSSENVEVVLQNVEFVKSLQKNVEREEEDIRGSQNLKEKKSDERNGAWSKLNKPEAGYVA